MSDIYEKKNVQCRIFMPNQISGPPCFKKWKLPRKPPQGHAKSRQVVQDGIV